MPQRKRLTPAQRDALIKAAEIASMVENDTLPIDPDVLKRAVHWLQDHADPVEPEESGPAWVQVGTVGVDAGMLYLGAPCMIGKTPLGRGDSEAAWQEFLQQIAGPEGYLETTSEVIGAYSSGFTINAGIVTTTGYGDGEYPVSVQFRDRRIARIKVDFMGGEE